MLNIAICDDDERFLEILKLKIRKKIEYENVRFNITAFSSGKDLIAEIEKNNNVYNVIFLDVVMPLIDGFKTAEKVRELNEHVTIIFLTNEEASVRKGYEYSAFRYIFKSELDEGLEEALSVILKKRENDENNATIEFKYVNEFEGEFEHIKVKENDIIKLTKKAYDRNIYLETVYGEYKLLSYTLAWYYKMLNNEEKFVILSRSNIVNFEHISRIKGDCFILSNGESVIIGSKKDIINNVKEKYTKYRANRV